LVRAILRDGTVDQQPNTPSRGRGAVRKLRAPGV